MRRTIKINALPEAWKSKWFEQLEYKSWNKSIGIDYNQ
jgi:hypothetical protein